jgi:hypothetical protein
MFTLFNYSDETRRFLCELVKDLQFSAMDLHDAYSHWTGNYDINSISKDDTIKND